MNSYPLRHLKLLVMHPDPIVRAGLVAALRQELTFEVSVHGVDSRPAGLRRSTW